MKPPPRKRSSTWKPFSPVSSPRLLSPARENGSEPREDPSPKRIRRPSSRLSNYSIGSGPGTSGMASPSGTPKGRRRSSTREETHEMETPHSEKRQKKQRNKRKSDDGEVVRKRTRFDDPNAPKRPRSSYVLFLSNRRLSIAKQHQVQKKFNLELASEWKALNDEERQPFIDLATKEKEAYEKEMEQYRQTDLYADFQRQKKENKKERMRKKRLHLLDESGISEPEEKKHRKKGHRRSKTEDNEEDAQLRSLRKEQAAMKEEIRKLRRETEILQNRIKTGKRTQEILKEVKPINEEIRLLERENKELREETEADNETREEIEDMINLWMEIARKALGEAKVPHSESDIGTPESLVEFLSALPNSAANSIRSVMKDVCDEYIPDE